jgi:alkaline phosphatase D
MLRRLFLSLLVALPTSLVAQRVEIRSGPMVGAADMREVKLWVQTTGAARVHVVYSEVAPDGVIALRLARRTAEVVTRRDSGYVAHLVADSVEPGTSYDYYVVINGRPVRHPYLTRFTTPPLWQYRTDPPAFSVLLGSCFYIREDGTDRPNSNYGDSTGVLRAMAARPSQVMLWLGDNTYLREADWNSWTGIVRRWTSTRSFRDLQPLLADRTHIAAWDDHDYGPNDSDRSFWNKDATKAAFDLFWRNPSSGLPGTGGGITTQYAWGDVEFFLMDDRWFRSPNRRSTASPRAYFGELQLQWLVDALTTSRATFKLVVVGGQVLNPAALFENYATYPEERQKLIDLITAERIPGVVFLTGDRHHTELTRLERPGTYPLYDFTVSPLSAGVSRPPENERNTGRVEGTLVNTQNFGELSFSGPRLSRTMTMKVFDAAGVEQWSRSFTAQDLGWPVPR